MDNKETKTLEMEEISVIEKYDLEKCVEWINSKEIDTVCLQFPDSLLSDSVQVALKLEKLLGRKVYILGDTTCGSCCVDEITAHHVQASGIIHFGHACLSPTTRLPVFHVLPKVEIDIDAVCTSLYDSFPDHSEKLIFFYDISYAHAVEHIYKRLTLKYKSLVLTKLNATSNVPFTDKNVDSTDVILGRTYSLENGYKIEDYEAFFLGDGNRTLSTLSISIPIKTWYHWDSGRIKKLDSLNAPWLKRRRFLIEKLKEAKVVGIVIATLEIKDYLEAVSSIKKILKAKNKKSYTFSINKLNPSKLANFLEVDAFVVITCPENDVFDSRDYFKPLLTPYELEVAFNSSRNPMENCHPMDFRQILPNGNNYIEFKASNEADVSLISGDMRCDAETTISTDKMDALVIKDSGTVAIGKAGASFLLERSWQGVEQRIGEDPKMIAEQGRSGLAYGYENEPK